MLKLKMNGEILPIGETNTDEKRLENLFNLEKFVMELVDKIDDVRFYNIIAYEYSRKQAANKAIDILKKIHSFIGDRLDLNGNQET